MAAVPDPNPISSRTFPRTCSSPRTISVACWCRRRLFEALPDDAEDYHSLVLRLVEQAPSVARLDTVLAHRFQGAAETGSGCIAKADTPPAFLGDFLRNRYGADATVTTGGASSRWRCDFGNRDASVSVILPTRDRLPLLRNCVRGIFESNSGRLRGGPARQ